MKFSKPKSILSVVGVTTAPIPVPMGRLMSSEIIIQGSCGYDHEDIVEVIDNLSAKRTYMPEIITHHYPLESINEAIKMASMRDQAIKVIIDMA
jgi:threonine dehydrogenase-like Zn-dependent dehydrogenase